ncbi:MAG TPA: alkaline phosphatase family protein [Rhizomicrobium sp.]
MKLLKNLRASALAAIASLGVATAADAAAPKHIFVIMMENHAYDEIIGNTKDAPFINQLASQYNVETEYYGVTHPSLPNYLAFASGSFQGIFDDCAAGKTITCAPEEFVPDSGDQTAGNFLTKQEIRKATNAPHWFRGDNIVDALESNGKTWKGYFQSMPKRGYDVEYAPTIDGTVVKLYAQKHNPFLYFSDIRHSDMRLSHIVPFENHFDSDLASGNVANFVFIAPDQCHDMHGISPSQAALVNQPQCGYPDSGLDHGAIKLGDRFLRNTVGKIMNSSVWQKGSSSIVIVWDEDDYSGFAGCCASPVGRNGIVLGGARVPMIVINSSDSGTAPTQLHVPANHYSLLATIETLWDLPCLAHSCEIDNAGQLRSMFR